MAVLQLRCPGERPNRVNLGRSARLLALLLPGLAFGQVCTNGKVRVSVLDSAGQTVSDVAVKLEGGSAAAIVRSTGPAGTADFDNLACNVYTIGLLKEGFQPLNGSAVQVTGEGPAELTVTLIPQIVRRERV